MAEAVLKDLINKKQLLNWYTDSAGLRDWNVGMQAQGRAQTLLHQHGLKTDHITRAVRNILNIKYNYANGISCR